MMQSHTSLYHISVLGATYDVCDECAMTDVSHCLYITPATGPYAIDLSTADGSKSGVSFSVTADTAHDS